MIIGRNIDLRPVEVKDAEFILSLRLDEKLSKYLHKVDNNVEKQREWLKSCIEDKDQYYYIVQNKFSRPVGTIRIYDIKGDIFCWGSWIIIPKARSFATLESIVLLYEFAFEKLNFDKTCFDVRRANEKALNFYLRFGATITHEDKLDCFLTYSIQDFAKNKAKYKVVIDKIVL